MRIGNKSPAPPYSILHAFLYAGEAPRFDNETLPENTDQQQRMEVGESPQGSGSTQPINVGAAVAAAFDQMAAQIPGEFFMAPPFRFQTEERRRLLQVIREKYKPDASWEWMYRWYILNVQRTVEATGNAPSEDAFRQG